MTQTDMIKKAPHLTKAQTIKQIEETAYFSWLNRGRYAQAGDELNDWMEAEKEVLNRIPVTQAAPLPVPISRPGLKSSP